MKVRYLQNLFCLSYLLSLLLICTSAIEGQKAAQTPLLTKENIAKLQSAADKIITNYNAPGMTACIYAEGEKELFITRGVSNLVTSEPMNEASYFRIASITKTFTTEAVLILADEGKIDLNKSISSYLPEYNIPEGGKITVRMLGNMTSGLSSYTENLDFMTKVLYYKGELTVTAEEIVAAAVKLPLKFTPGSKYEYCNSNTIILGLLIQKVTGKSVRQVLSEKIFQPLGMTSTYWPVSRFLPYPYSHGYSSSTVTGILTDVTNYSPSWGDAAGILISNFSDLKIWMKEIKERNLLSATTKEERIKWVDEGNGKSFYGFGLMKINGWIGHSGIISGYNSQVYYYPEKKITILVYTNCEDGEPAAMALMEFMKILTP